MGCINDKCLESVKEPIDYVRLFITRILILHMCGMSSNTMIVTMCGISSPF